MKLLLDENIGKKAVDTLKESDLEVKSIFEDRRGATDRKVLDLAIEEKRIVVTLDKDFGKLIFRDLKPHSGVLFLKLKRETGNNIAKSVIEVCDKYEDELHNKFVTVTSSEIRIR